MTTLLPNVLFLGTPEYAVRCLEKLIQTKVCRIASVLTQPDRPAGRGKKTLPPPIKDYAQAHGIKVIQAPSLKGLSLSDGVLKGKEEQAELVAELNSISPLDLIISVAYGNIIPEAILGFSKHGVINVHPSLLPRWRGAAPIQHALFAGDAETGVCIMQVDAGLDTGPVFEMKHVPIFENDTFGSLEHRLADIGSDMLAAIIPGILSGDKVAKAQTEDGATYAHKWDKEDLCLDFSEDTEITLRRIRTCAPELGARTLLEGELVKVFKAHKVSDRHFSETPPGVIVEVTKNEIIVSSGKSEYIALDELQLAGKKKLSTEELLRGRKIPEGLRFETIGNTT